MPFGFVAIQNNLNPLLESFARVKKEAGGTMGAFRAILGTLAGGGGLGFAFSAITAAVSFATAGFGAWTRGISGASDAAQDASKKVKEAGESFAKVAAGFAADNVAKIEVFRLALTKVNIPLSERSKILDDYNKLVDKQNELSEKDLTNIGKINAAVNAQIDLFQRRAVVMAAQNKIVDLFKDVFENQFNLTKGTLGLNDATKAVGKSFGGANAALAEWNSNLDTINKTAAKAPEFKFLSREQIANLKDSTTGITFMEQALGRLSSNDYDVDVNTGKITNKADKLIGNIRNTRKEIKDLLAFINGQIDIAGLDVLQNFDSKIQPPKGEFNFFDKFFDFSPYKAQLAEKQIASLVDAAKAFQKEFGSGLGLRIDVPKFDTMSEQDALKAARTFWLNFQKGVLKFKPPVIEVDFTVVPTLNGKFDLLPQFLEGLKQQAEKINSTSINLRPDITYDADRAGILANFKKTFAGIGRQLPKMIESGGINDKGAKVLIPIELATNLEQLKAGLIAAGYDVRTTLEKLNDTVSASIRGMMTNVMGGIGEAIGVALAGGDFADVFKGIFASLGGAIQQLGTEIIALSPLIAAVKKAFQSLQPAAMLAAGVGLVAIGAALKTSFSKVAHLEQGGIIPDGFSGDRFPAMLNSREAVIPLDKLDRYINMPQAASSGPERIRLRGADLELSRARNARRDNRIR